MLSFRNTYTLILYWHLVLRTTKAALFLPVCWTQWKLTQTISSNRLLIQYAKSHNKIKAKVSLFDSTMCDDKHANTIYQHELISFCQEMMSFLTIGWTSNLLITNVSFVKIQFNIVCERQRSQSRVSTHTYAATDARTLNHLLPREERY